MTKPSRTDDSTALLRRPAPPRPLGVIIRAPDGTNTALREGSCIVGSGSACAIVLHDSTVSRRHAELKLDPMGVRVRDLGSNNGTYYLGQRIQEAVLGLGSRIDLGRSSLFLDADTTPVGAIQPFPLDEYGGLIGVSLPMRRLFALMHRLEGSLATVLIEGESGVGKELVAQALHAASTVSEGAFVPLNCGALPRELVASELFGHKRGAFSGAVDARMGAFEAAEGGTLFLDEIGELPLDVQPVLLRVLETGEIRAVGEDRARKSRVRIVAATNRDLHDEVRRGRFREDLYFRLAVIRLTIPPLRDRTEDIEPLARRFSERIGAALPDEVVEGLKHRPFPGNVRELRNAVESYTTLRFMPAAHGAIPSADLEGELKRSVDLARPYLEQRDLLVDKFTRVYLDALLKQAGGNQSAAARIAGLDRTYLGKLLARHNGPKSGTS